MSIKHTTKARGQGFSDQNEYTGLVSSTLPGAARNRLALFAERGWTPRVVRSVGNISGVAVEGRLVAPCF